MHYTTIRQIHLAITLSRVREQNLASHFCNNQSPTNERQQQQQQQQQQQRQTAQQHNKRRVNNDLTDFDDYS
jgi:alanine racemase